MRGMYEVFIKLPDGSVRTLYRGQASDERAAVAVAALGLDQELVQKAVK